MTCECEVEEETFRGLCLNNWRQCRHYLEKNPPPRKLPREWLKEAEKIPGL